MTIYRRMPPEKIGKSVSCPTCGLMGMVVQTAEGEQGIAHARPTYGDASAYCKVIPAGSRFGAVEMRRA